MSDAEGLDLCCRVLDEAISVIPLDLETTGLDPRQDRTRLLTIGLPTTEGGTLAHIVDCAAVDVSPLWERLRGKALVIHNAAFDLAFLNRMGFTPSGPVHDTMLMAQILLAGTRQPVNLKACCSRWLKREIDKDAQVSNWSGRLTSAQLAYAATDVDVLLPLYDALRAEIESSKQEKVYEIERRCLPAMVWTSASGVPLDRDRWGSLASTATDDAERLRSELDAAAPLRPGALPGCTGWKWDSTKDTLAALQQAGCRLDSTDDDALAGASHPLAELLRQYRDASKRGGSFGKDWLKHVSDDGRVYPSWRQIGADSGRMSCSRPNMQQLPRGEYRQCIAAPPGRVLVKADYSQVELRIAAQVSRDKALLDAYRRGEDLHTLTARKVLGIEEVTKDHRQLAKALNFGLLYGMGAKGFRIYAKSQYGTDLTEQQAGQYRAAFFKAYPALAEWHKQTDRKRPTQTRTLAGRRRLTVEGTSLNQLLNTPVQGTGADGLKAALGLLWERREQVPGAFPVLIVHDEIVIECDEQQVDVVSAWLKQAMLDGMAPLIDPVPVEVAVKVGKTWGG